MDPALRAHIPILADPTLYPNKILSEHNPTLVLLPNLLSPNECQHIINKAKDKLFSSTMIVNNQEVVNASRNSKSAFITSNGVLPTDDAVIHRFLSRLSRLCGTPTTHFEGMKVVNYQKDQQYLAHYDFFREHDNFLQTAGDRMYTFFIYLNTLQPEDGGTTSFPKINLTCQPHAGDGLFWVNIHPLHPDQYEDNALHSGDPVLTNTEKWGVNVWVRQRSYL